MKKILSALLVSTLFACTGNNSNQQEGTSSPSSQSSAVKFDPNKEYNISMETSMGTMKLKLYPKVAPKTVENFVTLASRNYYNGITFHRVIEGFMIQGGDPTGTGTAGESAWGGKFEDEFSANVKFDKVGLLAMANSGPATNGSQFFITLSPKATQHLHMKHTIFGEVTEGMDVLKAIGKTGVTPDDKPIVAVVMKKVSVL